MVMTVVFGLPRVALVGALKIRLNVSFPSAAVSFVILTVDFFDVSPGAKDSEPFGPVKSLGYTALPFVDE